MNSVILPEQKTDLEAAEDKQQQVDQVFREEMLKILTQLYHMKCTCRKQFGELDDIVDPKFHLDDCEYIEALNSINFKYAD